MFRTNIDNDLERTAAMINAPLLLLLKLKPLVFVVLLIEWIQWRTDRCLLQGSHPPSSPSKFLLP